MIIISLKHKSHQFLSLIFCIFIASSCVAEGLSHKDALIGNRLLRFTHVIPVSKNFKYCQSALKHSNELIRGISSLVMFKHFGKRYNSLVDNLFTLNNKKVKFKRAKRCFIKMTNLNKMTKSATKSFRNFYDDRLKSFVLYFYFRKANTWVIGAHGEKLSLAKFYRTNIFRRMLGKKLSSSDFIKSIDVYTKPSNTKKDVSASLKE